MRCHVQTFTKTVRPLALVLVVDEHPVLRLLLRTVLENHGHIVRKAADGDAALVHVVTSPIQLVVADLNTSLTTGELLVTALRSLSDAERPMIIVTGEDIPSDLEGRVFQKPYSAQAVAKAVDSLTS